MGSRGRKSADSMAIAALSASTIEAVQRPDAPYDLTDEQADEWRAIISSLPADWFQRCNHSMLTELCRAVVTSRRNAQLMEQCCAGPEIDRKEFADLARVQDMLAKTISALLRGMRLTQQSLMRAETAKRPTQVKNPWDA